MFMNMQITANLMCTECYTRKERSHINGLRTKLYVIYNTTEICCQNFIMCINMYITTVLMCTGFDTKKEQSNLKIHGYKVLYNEKYYLDQLS